MHEGKILYRYTVSNGEFFIHKGVVTDCGTRLLVNFKDSGSTLRCPKEEELGKIRSIGRSLWLDHRDDDKARMIFIHYELDRIKNLREQIDKKLEIIETLIDGIGDMED